MSKDRPISTGVVSSTQVFAEPQEIDGTIAMTDDQIVETTAFSQPNSLIGAVLNDRFHLKEIIDQGLLGPVNLVELTTNRNSQWGAWVWNIHPKGHFPFLRRRSILPS